MKEMRTENGNRSTVGGDAIFTKKKKGSQEGKVLPRAAGISQTSLLRRHNEEK